MKRWHLIIVNSECSLSPLCWPLFNIVTQKQKWRFDFSYWTSDPSLDFGDCGIVFLWRKVEDENFLQQPSIFFFYPSLVATALRCFRMTSLATHLISQYFLLQNRNLQKKQKQKPNYYSKSFWNSLHAKPFASIQKRQCIVKRKTSILFLWQSWLNIPMLLVASAEQTHFVSHFSCCPYHSPTF